MRKLTTVRLPKVVLFFAAIFCFTAFSCKRTSDPQRRRVVLYCSVDQGIAEPIVAEFERQTGIEVSARYDTEASKTVGLVQRIRAEGASPIADVFWSSEIFHTVRLARDSLLAAYRSERTANWPGKFADSQGRWYGFALRARVIAYNTRRVSAEQAPRTLEDVLDRRWRGKIVMAAPEFGTTGGDVASWFVHYGIDRATEILRQLKANEIRLVEGNSTAVRMVATGQADICFTDTDDVYAGVRNGWPVAMNYLDQGGDGPLTIPNTAGVINGAPHPEEAKTLMDFLLSEKAEQMLAESDSHNAPIHAGLAERFKSYAVANPLSVDYEKVAEHLQIAITTSKGILR
ncbi:MAG: extracellular solute-binding protein [Planctomycetota bacterium]|jgi:iron(III) transport system substrate-binding protein